MRDTPYRNPQADTPRPGNASKWLPGNRLERVFRLGLEMLQHGFLETVWSEFSASVWKCFKMASWKPFGASFLPRPGNASKWFPGSRLERVFGLGLEMLQNAFLEPV